MNRSSSQQLFKINFRNFPLFAEEYGVYTLFDKEEESGEYYFFKLIVIVLLIVTCSGNVLKY